MYIIDQKLENCFARLLIERNYRNQILEISYHYNYIGSELSLRQVMIFTEEEAR